MPQPDWQTYFYKLRQLIDNGTGWFLSWIVKRAQSGRVYLYIVRFLDKHTAGHDPIESNYNLTYVRQRANFTQNLCDFFPVNGIPSLKTVPIFGGCYSGRVI